MMQTSRAAYQRAMLARSLQGGQPGPCTAQTLRCGTARSYQVELPRCCRAHLIRIVTAAVEALEEFKVTYWADYGTLLGAVRNPLTTWADYPWLPQEGRAV